ncbi:MAG TPA: TorF family putative porin [Burkholderiaceae bacterium]|nr:TorF family putative porin [Burkholderiaceae bacterium]
MAAWLAALALAGSKAFAADPWGGALTLTTDYIFRGVSQSNGNPAAQVDLHARSPAGWFAGAWSSTANPPPSYAGSPEVDLYAGFGRPLSDRWVATLSVVRYLYPNASPSSHYDASELSGTLRFDDWLALSAAVSPDARRYSVQGWSARGETRSCEASLRQPVFGAVSIVAALGYYDTQALLGESYRAWDGGLTTHAGPVELALLRFGVDAAARRLFGSDAADGHWVLTATWRF